MLRIESESVCLCKYMFIHSLSLFQQKYTKKVAFDVWSVTLVQFWGIAINSVT